MASAGWSSAPSTSLYSTPVSFWWITDGDAVVGGDVGGDGRGQQQHPHQVVGDLAHGVEDGNDLLLPADHVERRQLAQPHRRYLGVLQRIGQIFRLRCQKSEHRFHRCCLSAVGVPLARAGNRGHCGSTGHRFVRKRTNPNL